MECILINNTHLFIERSNIEAESYHPADPDSSYSDSVCAINAARSISIDQNSKIVAIAKAPQKTTEEPNEAVGIKAKDIDIRDGSSVEAYGSNAANSYGAVSGTSVIIDDNVSFLILAGETRAVKSARDLYTELPLHCWADMEGTQYEKELECKTYDMDDIPNHKRLSTEGSKDIAYTVTGYSGTYER